MKNLLACLLLLASSFAHASAVPYTSEAEARFQAVEAGTGLATGAVTGAAILDGTINVADTAAMSAGGHYLARQAKVTWDPSGVAGDRTVAAHASGIVIPANAIIRQVWFYTKTSLVSTGNNGTIAVSCNGANDIFSAADIDASSGVAGQIGAGVQVGTAATMLKVSTACDITFTVAVNAFTAGKMDWFIDYVIAE